jgi:hypothetical protein
MEERERERERAGQEKNFFFFILRERGILRNQTSLCLSLSKLSQEN